MNNLNVTIEKKQYFNLLTNVQCPKNTKATNSFQVWNVCFSFYRDMFHFYFLKSSNNIFCFPVYCCFVCTLVAQNLQPRRKMYICPGNRKSFMVLQVQLQSLRGQFFQFEYLFTLPKMPQIDLNLFSVSRL